MTNIPEIPNTKTYDHLDKMTDAPIPNATDKNVDLHDVIEIIFPDNDVFSKSVLNGQQVLAIAQAYVVAEQFDNDVIRRLIRILLKTQMSFGGWARKDMRAILSYALNSTNEREEDSKFASLKRRLFGSGAQ